MILIIKRAQTILLHNISLVGELLVISGLYHVSENIDQRGLYKHSFSQLHQNNKRNIFESARWRESDLFYHIIWKKEAKKPFENADTPRP